MDREQDVTPPSLAPAAPAAPPPARRRSGLIVVAALCVLLLFAAGIYFASTLEPAPNNGPQPAGASQNAARPADSSAKTAVAPANAKTAGNPIADALGPAAQGGPDPGKAPDDPAPASQAPPPASNGGASADANSGGAAGAAAGFLGALSSAVGGAHRHDPVDFHTLEALLPSSLPGMQPAAPAGNADDTMSIKTTSAHVDFSGPSNARINVSIRDATAISGLAGLADMANPNQSEQGDSYEKTETIGGRSVHERWDATVRHGELSLSVGERFAVDVVGDNVDMDALKNALAHIDLAKLESMKDANPVTK